MDKLSTTRRGFLFGVSATAVTLALPKITLPKLSGFAAPVDVHRIYSVLWSQQMKEALLDDLVSMKFSAFTDGDANG